MALFCMAKTVLKSLFKKSATVKYPFAPQQYHKNTRGKISNDISRCIFCGLCQRKCPTFAISVSKDEKKWAISRLHCMTCGYCVEVCPKKCLAMENCYTEPCFAKGEDVLWGNKV